MHARATACKALIGKIGRTVLGTRPARVAADIHRAPHGFIQTSVSSRTSKHILVEISRQSSGHARYPPLSPYLQASPGNLRSGGAIYRPYQLHEFHSTAKRAQQKEKIAPGTPTVHTLDEALEDKAFSLSERAQVHTSDLHITK